MSNKHTVFVSKNKKDKTTTTISVDRRFSMEFDGAKQLNVQYVYITLSHNEQRDLPNRAIVTFVYDSDTCELTNISLGRIGYE